MGHDDKNSTWEWDDCHTDQSSTSTTFASTSTRTNNVNNGINDVDNIVSASPPTKKRRQNCNDKLNIIERTLPLPETQTTSLASMAQPIPTSAPNTTPATATTGHKMGQLNGYQVYYTAEYIYGQHAHNKADKTNNDYILTSNRAKLLSYGFVRQFTKSLSMDIASIVNKYYGNDYLDVDIRHPELASHGREHSQHLSTLLFDLDGISMTTYSKTSRNKIIDASKILFSVELLGESKCKMDCHGVSMWWRGYSRNVLKTTSIGNNKMDYYTKDNFFDNVAKTGESFDDYDCKHNIWTRGLPATSDIYSKLGMTHSYTVRMESGLSYIDNALDPNVGDKNENDDGWHALKFGISTLYATLDCQEQKIIIERKDNNRNNGEKQHIDTSALAQDKFYIFFLLLKGCNCKHIKKGGMVYRIKIEQK